MGNYLLTLIQFFGVRMDPAKIEIVTLRYDFNQYTTLTKYFGRNFKSVCVLITTCIGVKMMLLWF